MDDKTDDLAQEIRRRARELAAPALEVVSRIAKGESPPQCYKRLRASTVLSAARLTFTLAGLADTTTAADIRRIEKLQERLDEIGASPPEPPPPSTGSEADEIAEGEMQTLICRQYPELAALMLQRGITTRQFMDMAEDEQTKLAELATTRERLADSCPALLAHLDAKNVPIDEYMDMPSEVRSRLRSAATQAFVKALHDEGLDVKNYRTAYLDVQQRVIANALEMIRE